MDAGLRLTARESTRRWPIAVTGLIELAVIVAASQYVATEVVPGYCDDNPALSGCPFLAGGGYTAIRLVPSAMVAFSLLMALHLRRLRLLHLGVALAALILFLAVGVEPSEYPFP